MRIEGERGRSSQNEHTLKREGRGGRGWSKTNKGGQGGEADGG